MPQDSPTDRADFLELQQGNERALDRLVARWQGPLMGFAYRYLQNAADAQDLVADAFVRLYQGRLRLRPDTNLSAWLFTTLSNLCHNRYRWRTRHPAISLESEEAGPAPSFADLRDAPDSSLVRDESIEAVRRAIDSLPHDLRLAVILHHYERLAYRDIARICDCSERGIETRLYRAKRLLRARLAEFVGEHAER